jgi:hypothetical protein
MEYVVRRAGRTPELAGQWDGSIWRQAETLEVTNYHAKSSEHRPLTQARLLYDDNSIYAIFRVADHYVRCTRTEYQSATCKDSCVEFFVQPHADQGYFNFETNCGGALLLNYNGPPKSQPVAREWLERFRIYHSAPAVVEPERVGPMTWIVEYAFPLALIEAYVRPVRPVAGATWRANFYKCASETSHPHWASWSPIGEQLGFHRVSTFGALRFEA